MSYIYQHVKSVRVIDGDTVELAIDLGNRVTWQENFRLNGIDTPERGQPGFHAATDALFAFLQNGIARVETFKPDKYGRWLVDIYIPVDGGELLVNKTMVVVGYAVSYDGGKK